MTTPPMTPPGAPKPAPGLAAVPGAHPGQPTHPAAPAQAAHPGHVVNPGQPAKAAEPHALKADAPTASSSASGMLGMLETFVGAILPDQDRVNVMLDAGRAAAEGAIHNLLMTLQGKIAQYYVSNFQKNAAPAAPASPSAPAAPTQ